MQVKVDVLPHLERGPGWAKLTVSGAASLDMQVLAGAMVSLQRNQDGRYLAERSQWSASEVWHMPEEASLTDSGCQLTIGPELVDELLLDPRMVCRMQVKLGDQRFVGVLRFGQGVYPSGAAGQSPDASREVQSVKAVVEPQPEPEPDLPLPVAPVAPMPPAAPARKSNLPVLLVLLLVALVGGALTWWLVAKPEVALIAEETAQISTADATAAPTVDEPPAPCTVQALAATTDDLAFLQACVSTNPNSADVMTLIDAGKAAGRCDLIQRLYAHQAQAGNVQVALAYAREFDPQTHRGGCFAQADAATAVYWYQIVLDKQPDDAAVKARIDALK
jgi:hypothetical protein